jgi:hypothetical protein
MYRREILALTRRGNALHKSEKGTSLVIVVGIIGVLLVIGTVASQVIINSFRFGANEKSTTRAFYAAEAGGNHVIGRLKNDLPSFSQKKTGGSIGIPYEQALPGQFWCGSWLLDPQHSL